MKVPHPIPDQLAELIARRFQVLGEPTRLRVLHRLREGEATVTELQEATGASQQNVSKHLGVLLEAGFVGRTREGNFVRYAIADDDVFELCEVVCGGIERRLGEVELLLRGGGDPR